MLIDAERPREGLDDLLNYATYVVSSAKFPQVLLLILSLFWKYDLYGYGDFLMHIFLMARSI